MSPIYEFIFALVQLIDVLLFFFMGIICGLLFGVYLICLKSTSPNLKPNDTFYNIYCGQIVVRRINSIIRHLLSGIKVTEFVIPPYITAKEIGYCIAKRILVIPCSFTKYKDVHFIQPYLCSYIQLP